MKDYFVTAFQMFKEAYKHKHFVVRSVDEAFYNRLKENADLDEYIKSEVAFKMSQDISNKMDYSIKTNNNNEVSDLINYTGSCYIFNEQEMTDFITKIVNFQNETLQKNDTDV
jgi:hypothetical protein